MIKTKRKYSIYIFIYTGIEYKRMNLLDRINARNPWNLAQYSNNAGCTALMYSISLNLPRFKVTCYCCCLALLTI